MVDFQPADVIALDEFEFKYRITNDKWSILPDETLKRIFPLSPSKSREVFSKSPLKGDAPCVFDPGKYHAVQHHSLKSDGMGTGSGDPAPARGWLRSLPIAANENVYVCWHVGDGVAAITEWELLSNIWEDLWYPFDRMAVFDESVEWAVLFGPQEHAAYIERGPVASDLPITDPAYGTQLVQPN